MSVYTQGPIVADLVSLADPTYEIVVRLGRTLGFEWLLSLVEIGRPEGLAEPALAVFLREHYALRPGFAPNPYGVRARQLVRKRPRAIPKEVIAEFTTSEAGRLADVAETLRWLVAPLLATARGTAQPADQQHDRATVLLNALDTPVRLHRFYDGPDKNSLYCSVPTNLYARALLEVIELYNDTPLLAICARCERLFVAQRKDNKYCRRYTWPADGGENIAGCLYDEWPTRRRAELDSEAHRREYKRLQMRVARSADKAGTSDPSTRQAQAEFEQWKRTHPISRGRRPTAMRPDLLPDPRSR
jgi:hypothetical protein